MTSPPPGNNNDGFGGRTLKRFRSLISTSPRDPSSRLGSPAAIDQVLSDGLSAKPDAASPRCASPPTPNIASLYVLRVKEPLASQYQQPADQSRSSFHDPIIADDTQEDPTIDEAAYEALIRDSKSRSRGRGLFDRYGLDIEKSGLTVSRDSPDAVPKARVLRTEKAVRVRRLHTCCQCSKQFGSEPICGGCEHKRCKKCPRYPPTKRDRDEGLARQLESTGDRPPSSAASVAAQSDTSDRRGANMYLHMPNSINYQAMQPRPVMFNRLRQICCACDQHFDPPDALRCRKCLHRQCKDCRQDFATQLRKRMREEELDEAFGDQEDDMEEDGRPHAPELSEMQDWHRNVDASVRRPLRRDCRACGAHFICGLQACSICEHSKCMACVRRTSRSASANSENQSHSSSAGEVGAQVYARLSANA